LPFLKPYKNSIYVALLFLTVTALVILSFGKVIKYLIDFGFVEKSLHALALSLLCFIVGVFVMAICGYFRSSIINIVAEKIINDIRCNIYQHVIRISIDFFENNKVGDISSRIIADTALIYNIATSNLSFLLRNIILFFGCIFCLFLTNWKLSLLMFFLIPVAIMPIIFLGKNVNFKLVNNRFLSKYKIVSNIMIVTMNFIFALR
jgi:ATP-binding cassette subfamily B protein